MIGNGTLEFVRDIFDEENKVIPFDSKPNVQEDKQGNKYIKIVEGQLNGTQTEVIGIGRCIELCTENDEEEIKKYTSISLKEGLFDG